MKLLFQKHQRMPSSLFVKEGSKVSENNGPFTPAVSISSLNRDGSRSAFTPYRPTTVLTNLQRGNVQTQTPTIQSERSIHQLSAQGELHLQSSNFEFDVNESDKDGLTPLMWACSYGQLETVRKLLSSNALISSIGNAGENALILASAAGHAAIVKDLISHGACLNYKDNDGNTALMFAAFNNHAACVQELLSAGADFTVTNEAFESAFDIAIKRRSKYAQAVLEKHMLNILQNEP